MLHEHLLYPWTLEHGFEDNLRVHKAPSASWVPGPGRRRARVGERAFTPATTIYKKIYNVEKLGVWVAMSIQ